jgi:hypothetical protein
MTRFKLGDIVTPKPERVTSTIHKQGYKAIVTLIINENHLQIRPLNVEDYPRDYFNEAVNTDNWMRVKPKRNLPEWF